MRIIKAVGLSAVGLSVMLATGCSRESNQTQAVRTQSEGRSSTAPASSEAARERGQALVRVVNASPETPAITVTADNAPAFSDVDYKAITPYKEIPASADEFAIKPAAQDAAQPMAENSEAIMSGRHYTLIAFSEPRGLVDRMTDGDRTDGERAARADKDAKDANKDAKDNDKRADADANKDANAAASAEKAAASAEKKVSLDVIADDLVPPSAGKARVRVINAATGTDDIAVFLRGQDDALFSDVDFKEAVSYKEVDPMQTTLELRTDTNALMDVNPKTGERSNETPVPTPRTDAARADRTPDRTGSDRMARDDRAADRAADDRAGTTRQPGALLGTQMLNLEAGKSYTILFVGRAEGTDRRLDMLVVEDTVPQQQATSPTDE